MAGLFRLCGATFGAIVSAAETAETGLNELKKAAGPMVNRACLLGLISLDSSVKQALAETGRSEADIDALYSVYGASQQQSTQQQSTQQQSTQQP